jgi:O-antigen/teichoic acid export membrane protein
MSIINQCKEAIKNPGFKSIGLYIFTNFFSKGISFILIPIFTNPAFLSPTDNGILSLFGSNMLMLTPFVTLGMVQSTSSDFYRKPKHEFANAFTSSFVVSCFLTLLSMLVLFIIKDYLQAKFEFPVSFVFLLPLLAFLTFSGEQLFAVIRNNNEVKRYATVGIVKTILEYSTAVIFIVFLFSGWEGRVWGITISLVMVNLYALYYYIKNKYISFGFTKKQIWEEMKFGLPVLIFQTSLFLAGSSNKLVLAVYDVDKHELGIYSIACVLGVIIGSLAQSIMLYVQPQLYKSISTGQATMQSFLKEFFRYFKILTVLLLVCIGVVLFTYAFLINKEYSKGISYFLLVALTSYLWNLNFYFFLFLLYFKEKKKILIMSLISIPCSLSINIYLVKKYLIFGDALSGFISTLILTGLTLLFTYRLIRETLGHHISKPVVAAV